LLSREAITALEKLELDIFNEQYRAEDERSGDPSEYDDDFRFHAGNVSKIILIHLPVVIEYARKDLGVHPKKFKWFSNIFK
jgi:hypothetical protein